MHDVEKLLVRFERSASAVGVRYAFVGAMAVMAWGQPRATNDIDVLVDVSHEQVNAFVAALAEEGIEGSVSDLDSAFLDRSHVSMFDEATGFRFDLKLADSTRERDEVRSAVRLPFHGSEISVVRPEEAVAFKLLFGTPLDRQDARSILMRQKDALDRARLDHWVDRLGVRDRLEKLLDSEDDEED